MGIFSKIFKSKDDDAEKTVKPAANAPGALTADAKKAAPAAKVQVKPDPNAFRYLSMPLVTEKATDLAMFNKYCFIVPKSVNKSEVLKKVINAYGVKPIKINFVQKAGKLVRYGRRFGETKAYKKAIVTLKAGDKIELYEGV